MGIGTLVVAKNADLTWSGGTFDGKSALRIAQGATLKLPDTKMTRTLSYSTLRNDGDVEWTGADLTMASGAVITNRGNFNASSGTYDKNVFSARRINGDQNCRFVNEAAGVTIGLYVGVSPGKTVEFNVPLVNTGKVFVFGGGTASFNWGGENSGEFFFSRFEGEEAPKPSTIRIGTPTVGGANVQPTFVWRAGGTLTKHPNVPTATLLLQGNSNTDQYPTLQVSKDLTIPEKFSLEMDHARVLEGRVILSSRASGSQRATHLEDMTLQIDKGAVYNMPSAGGTRDNALLCSLEFGETLISNSGTLSLSSVLFLEPRTRLNNSALPLGWILPGRMNFLDGATVRPYINEVLGGTVENGGGRMVFSGKVNFDDIIFHEDKGVTVEGKGVFTRRRYDAKIQDYRSMGSRTADGPGPVVPNLEFEGALEMNATGDGYTAPPGSRTYGNGTLVWQSWDNQGTVAPGGDYLPGMLAFEGNYTHSASGVLSIELGGAIGSDMIEVEGGVTLAGSLALSLLPDFYANAGSYTIIDNDLSDPVVGTFTGLDPDDSVWLGTREFKINYHGGDGNDVVLTLQSNSPPSPPLIGDYIWLDMYGNGIQGMYNSGLAGVRVDLLDEDGDFLGSTVSGIQGAYGFYNIQPGIYQLRVAAPLGYHLTTPNAGFNDLLDSDADQITGLTHQFTLLAGTSDLSIDVGLVPNQAPNAVNDMASVVAGGSVTINVLANDSDPDGDALTITDVNQPMYGSVAISDNGTPADPSDDQIVYTHNGGTQFPDAFMYTISDGHGGSDTTWVYITEQQPPPPETGSIGDRVWLDSNDNGIQDPGEAGVSGVSVDLLDAQGEYLDSRTTDGNGAYQFTGLAAGMYSLQFHGRADMDFVAINQGSDSELDSDADLVTGLTASITLASNQTLTGWDAGLKLKSGGSGEEGPGEGGSTGGTGNTNSISGRTWIDTDGDGIQDTDEVGTAGLTVTLRDANGTVVQTTTTDANGYYWFASLAAGQYSVVFASLADHGFSPVDAGSDDMLDSDVDAGGQSVLFTIGALDLIQHLDAGLVPQGGA